MLLKLGVLRCNFVRQCRMLAKSKCVPVERLVTLRREPKADTFSIHFKLYVDELQLTRDFTLSRRTNETVDVLLARLKTNLEKVMGRKLKKTKNKLGVVKGSPEEKDFFQITAEIRKNDEPAPSHLTCEQLFFNNKEETGDVTFHLCGIPFQVTINTPYISKMSLPNVAMAGLPLYPLKFAMKFGDREKSIFKWFVSDNGVTWQLTGEEFVYYPKSEDIGKLLKVECVPSNGTTSGDTYSAIIETPVQPSPGLIPYKKRHQLSLENVNYPQFRVISYNILADKYAETEAANNELFPYCPDFARTWPYRRQMIVDELMGYNGDIICLQEVDTKAFDYDLTVFFKNKYKGIFNRKFTVEEGVAIFFNRSRYKLINNFTCFLGTEVDQNVVFEKIWENIKGNENLSARVRGLGTVAQAVVLSEKDFPEKITVVGNTHLYFHPDSDHIRLLQGGMLAKFLEQAVESVKKEIPDSTVGLVVCGDFNSVPSCGIYSLFTKGVAPADLPDWKSKDDEAVVGLELQQPILLESAYGTPQYTNFTAEFADCLDYIYFQKDVLQVSKVNPLFSEEELKAHTALPSVVCPSDHIALVADLSWTKI